MLSFKDAIRFPIYIYGKCVFRQLDGHVVIKSTLYPGMVKIGRNDWYVANSVPLSILTVNGDLIFNGPISFYHGTYLLVASNAQLSFGTAGTLVGSNSKIICFDRIYIGNTVRIAWDVTIYDTSFHYIENLKSGEVRSLTKPVVIGNNVWIGNKTTLSKGSVLPDNTIIASGSLVNKDFSSIPPFCLLAGSPATIKSTDLKRIFDNDKQEAMDVRYHYDRTPL